MFGRDKIVDPFNTMGNDSQHHTTPCDTEGAWWAKKNPMGWGNDNPRAVRDSRPTLHGSKAEFRLMSGIGGIIDRDPRGRVPVSGDKPGRNASKPRGRKRP
jgi:hypothetical protein